MRNLGVLVLLAGIALTRCYLDPPSSFSRIVGFMRAPTATPTTRPVFSSEDTVYDHAQTNQTHPQAAGVTNNVHVYATSNVPLFRHTRRARRSGATARMTSAASFLPPSDPTERYKLAIEMQQQLKSLGCYWGHIDGSWGAGSQSAMQAFLKRINARLSANEPNSALFLLLQSHDGLTCGGCSDGKKLALSGSCLSPAKLAGRSPPKGPIVASATSPKPNGMEQFRRETPDPAHRLMFSEPTSLQGRMSVGGPIPLPQYPPAGDLGVVDMSGEKSKPSQLSKKRKRRGRAQKAYADGGKRARRTDPIRRNLMLSLGGVF
jgi:hypothetical protein